MRRALACLALLSAVATLAAQGQPSTTATYERPIVTIGGGPQRLAIDAPLLAGGAPFRVIRRGERFYAEDGLNDLRLFGGGGRGGEGGRSVPHLLIQPPLPEREWITGRILPIAATKRTSGFEVDLGESEAIDMIRVDGLPAPHLKRVSIEGSGDRARWTTLVAEGTIFDLPDEQLRQNALAFTAGPYRYFRVTWNDANSGRVPSPSTVAARRVSIVGAPPATSVNAALERRPSEPGVSRFRVRLPGPRLPIVAIELDVATASGAAGSYVYRRAIVTESRFAEVEAAPAELGRAMLSRVVRDGATAAALRVPIAAPTEAEIELTIEDGANEPLDLGGVSVVFAELPWIYFEAPAGAVTARYGDVTLARPVYDLEAARDTIDLAKVPEARWGDGGTARISRQAGSTAIETPAGGPVLDAGAFTYARTVESSTVAGLVALRLDAHVLANSRGAGARFADVRVLDSANRQLPYLVERRNEPLSLPLAIERAPDARAQLLKSPQGSRQRSVYVVTLPYPNLPPPTLVLETSARVFQRTVQIAVERPPNRHRRDAYVDILAAETWRHADDERPARALTLRLGTMPETELLLIVEEGDNAALPITAARLLLPSYRLRFFHPGTTAVRLAYGRGDLQPPQYDLALLAPRVMGASAQEVSAVASTAAPPSPAPAIASPRTFWVVLSGAVLVLLALIVKLIRGQGGQAEG